MASNTLIAEAEGFALDRAAHGRESLRAGFADAAIVLQRLREGADTSPHELTGQEDPDIVYHPDTAAALDDVCGFLVDAGRPGHEPLVARLRAIVDTDSAGGATELSW